MPDVAQIFGVIVRHAAAWPYEPYTFRALQKTFGPMWVRCDVCRRYASLRLAGLLDVDYRTKRFSCSRATYGPSYLAGFRGGGSIPPAPLRSGCGSAMPAAPQP